ncbi:MAG: Heat shock protein DnaJ domain protein [Rickettsiaceae bacterium]|jgi:hypothetical protein|nr:Heat shock protein DnaJ domain protein [Rickettsiaceae bacterium]
MLFLLIGFVIFITFIFIIKGLSSPNPQIVKKAYKNTMIVLAIIMVFILLRFGQPLIALLITIIVTIGPYMVRLFQTGMALKMFHDWLNKKQAKDPTPLTKMTREEALEVLGLKEGCTRQEIETAYKNLMKKNHPDAGGSEYFAVKLNQARDLLL